MWTNFVFVLLLFTELPWGRFSLVVAMFLCTFAINCQLCPKLEFQCFVIQVNAMIGSKVTAIIMTKIGFYVLICLWLSIEGPWLWLLALITCDRWQATRNTRQVICDMWHLTPDLWYFDLIYLIFLYLLFYPHTSRDSVFFLHLWF